MKIIPLVIGLTVGVLLMIGLVGPIATDAMVTEKTFTNDGVFNYGIFTPDDEYKLEYLEDGTLEINDVPVTIPGVEPGITSTRYSVLASENVIIRYGSSSTGYLTQIVGVDASDAGLSPAPKSITATISDGQIVMDFITGTDTENHKVFNFTELYSIVPETDVAVMKVATGTVYIKGDSEIYGTGLTTVTGWQNMFHIEGTYDDGITITSPNLTAATYSNITWNIETVAGYIDLYKLTSIEFDITYNDTTVHATYSYFGVPSKVTAELSNHLDPAEITLVSAIVLIGLVALIAYAAYSIRGREFD